MPAVTLPSFLNAGFSLPSVSGVVSARTDSSLSNITGSPFFCGIATGRISAVNLPAACAAAAFLWLSAANASCSSRVTLKAAATVSPALPMCQFSNGHHRPS